MLVCVNCNTSEPLFNLPHLPPVGDLSTGSSGCEWQRRRNHVAFAFMGKLCLYLPLQVFATKTFVGLGQ